MNAMKERWGVIFDMDGVLIDSYKAHFMSWKKMLQKRNLNITEEQFSSTFGQTNKDIISRLFPFIKEEEYDAMAEEKEDIFREIIKSDFPEMDGASELIRALYNEGALLGIGSSAPLKNIETVLKLLGAEDCFKAIVSGNDITYGKPHPEVFLKTAERLGIAPSLCVVIEDSPAGIKAAKSAGCAAIGLTGTVSEDMLKEADMVINSLRELSPKLLRNLVKC